ncbi:MAG: hypothetical protein F6J95_027225 [Leptolyngbya sp. SIO1E4]|nr:hypothetical protein [Leptolyngbya sp. SIO1E4]
METAFRYWQLVRLDSSGHCYTQVMSQVQTWLQATFADLISDPATPDRQLQTALLAIYQAKQASADLAELSLRCYISHRIRLVCLQLASQFGDNYGFTTADLLPLVLDDDGKLLTPYLPLSLKILDTYDPTKAQLNTWVTRLVKNHPELDRALLERGLYRASDWAILNDTNLEQLQRILRQYHLCSETEVALASQLLEQYHQVYRQDRLQQRRAGQRGRCLPPTPEQLKRMDTQQSAKTVLTQLKALAAQLRHYRIHVRSGRPIPYRDETDWENHVPDGLGGQSSEAEENQDAFLKAYRQALQDCLENVLTQVMQANIAKLQKRRPPKNEAYVRGLYLFHCEGLSMGNLAAQVGLATQVQVNRLLQLKRLRADVRHLLIQQLQVRVRMEALDYISAERLNQIDQTLEHLLTERVDQVINEAASEAQIPQGRTAKSVFAHQLCQTIHHFME